MPYSVLVKHGIGWKVEATYAKKEQAASRERMLKANRYTTRIIKHDAPKPPISAYGG